MKLSIQLHLAELSFLNTVSIFELFDVTRARSTVHKWVHKADLQPEPDQNPDHVAVDKTVIRLNNERYWLYAAVDPGTNELLYTRLEPTTNSVIAHAFVAEHREKHDVDNAVFLIDGSHSLKDACRRHGLDFRYEKRGNRDSVERVLQEIKRRNINFSTVIATPKQKLPTSGSDHSASHGISLSEHYPLNDADTLDSVYRKLAEAGSSLAVELLATYPGLPADQANNTTPEDYHGVPTPEERRMFVERGNAFL